MAKPSAPASFTVTRLGPRDFRFSWSKVSGATSYGIRYLHGTQTVYTKWVSGIKGTSFVGRGFSGQVARRFAVYAHNKDGNSAYKKVDTFWYLPLNKPTNLKITANPQNASATITWSPNGAYYQSGIEVERSDGTFFLVGSGTGGNVGTSWTDTSAVGDVSYRVRYFAGAVGAVVDGVQQTRVFGVWSAWSKTVFAGFTPPLAPVVTVVNTAVGVSPRVTVGFESTDGTPQTGVEVRYRKVGASPWSTVSGTTAKYLDLPNNLTAGEWEVQARSKGAAATWSDWSPVTVFLMVTRPVITIANPPSVFTGGQVTATWATAQAEGVPQSLFEVELRQGGNTLAQEMGVGAGTAVRLPFDLSDEVSYVVAVTVWCSGVASSTVTKNFTTDFVKPMTPLLEAVWVEEVGAHEVTVDVPPLRPIFDVYVVSGRVFFDETEPVGLG